jgi:hypothetical protein
MASFTSLRLQATRTGHRFLGEHHLRLRRRRGDGHFGVLGIPGADGDDIQLFLVQHLTQIQIGRLHIEVCRITGQRLRMGIGTGDDFGMFALRPATAMFTGNTP